MTVAGVYLDATDIGLIVVALGILNLPLIIMLFSSSGPEGPGE